MKKWQILICMISVLLFGFFSNKKDVEEVEKRKPQQNIVVHIEGAVQNEGDYTFEKVCSIEEALKMVQVLPEAKLECLNLQGLIEHEMLIYVPFQKENLISLNTASQEELETIPGIGPAKATAIIEARPFTCLEDLMNVKGIGEKSYRKYREYVCL